MNKKYYHTPYTECIKLEGCRLMDTINPSRNTNPVETGIGGETPPSPAAPGRKVF